MVQVHRIFAAYMNGFKPLEPDVNKWLSDNNITADRLIRVTFHFEQIATMYPPPNHFQLSSYAVIYYTHE